MTRRGVALEVAVLGLLHDTPMHGYELRKQVNALLGWGRILSYGTLYPCLKALGRAGHDVAGPAECLETRVESSVRQDAAPPEQGVDLLAQLVPVHGRVVQQSEDRHLQRHTASCHLARSSILTK